MSPRKLRLKLIATMSKHGDTQMDVAYHAKVSQPTISRFLRGSDCSWLTRWGIKAYIKRGKTSINRADTTKDYSPFISA